MKFNNNVDVNELGNGNLMIEGDYECTIVKAEMRTAKTSGNEYVGLDFKVRTDVEQKYGNKHIFVNIFQKDGSWSDSRINKVAAACGIPKGQNYELDDLVNKSVICNVKIGKNQKDEDENYVAWWNTTKVGSEVKSLTPEPAPNTGTPAPVPDGFMNISDGVGEGLPFN